MSSSELGPDIGSPDFWIDQTYDGDAEEAVIDHPDGSYDLEDFVYDNFHEATTRGGAEYSREKFLNLFRVADSYDPADLVGRSDEVAGIAFRDSEGKAVYGLLQDHGDTVEFDIKVFGDLLGVVSHLETVPTGGYVEGVESVDGQAFKNYAVSAGDHPMDVDMDTQLDSPGEATDESFTNSQAERIKNQVLGEST